jgi:hypothetical protein
MKRVGYDADTERYFFRDSSTGLMYQSERGNAYGVLRPVDRPERVFERARPGAFASDCE